MFTIWSLNMKKNYLLLIIISLISVACASPSPENDATTNKEDSTQAQMQNGMPVWISSVEAVYPEKDYITGLGHGATLQDAQNEALAALSSYMQQSIESISESRGTISISGADMEAEYDVTETMVSSSTIANLVGVGIKERWFDDNANYYALAVLDKDESASFYVDKLRKNIDAINGFLAIARAKPSTFESHFAYISALDLANENENYLTILATVDNSRRRLYEQQSPAPASIAFEAQEAVEDITLGVKVKNDINNSIELQLIEIFNELGIKALAEDSQFVPAYIFDCNLLLEELPARGNTLFYNYTLTGKLLDDMNGKTLTTINHSGRAGHMNEVEVKNRALASINNYLKKEFVKELEKMSIADK